MLMPSSACSQAAPSRMSPGGRRVARGDGNPRRRRDTERLPSAYASAVDCPRAVGASEGGRDGHAEEAIDSKGRRQGDKGVLNEAGAAVGIGRGDGPTGLQASVCAVRIQVHDIAARGIKGDDDPKSRGEGGHVGAEGDGSWSR